MPNFTRTLLVIVFLFYSITSNAQECLWAHTAGTHDVSQSDANASAVVTDKSGNVYVAGTYAPPGIYFGTTYLPTATFGAAYNFYLAKYDSSGNFLWVKQFGRDAEYVGSMTIDTSGNLYIAVVCESGSVTFGTTTINNTGLHAFVLLKLDTTGSVIWAKSVLGLLGTDSYEPTNVTTDLAGNIFVTGAYGGTMNFGSVSLVHPFTSGTSVFLVKYNSSGSVMWAKSSHGNARFDSPGGIATDRGGNVYITGSYASSPISFDAFNLSNPLFPATTYVTFVVKYTASGNAAWAYSIGDSDLVSFREIRGSGMVIDANDNIYTMGNFNTDTLTIGSTKLVNAGADDIFLAKFNTSGSPVWIKKWGGTSGDHGRTITADVAGNIYIGGEFLSPSITFGTTTLTHQGMYLARFDNSGNATWAKHANSDTTTTYTRNIAHDAFGNLYACGSFVKPFALDAVPLVNPYMPRYHAYVAKFGIKPSAVSEIYSQHNIHIYPNPTTGALHIEQINPNTAYNLYNLLGAVVQQGILPHTNSTISLHAQPPGMYLLQLTDEQGRREVRKVVKE